MLRPALAVADAMVGGVDLGVSAGAVISPPV